MSSISIFDIFMAVIAAYVLISAIIGSGRIFIVQNVKEGREEIVQKGQRWFYLVIGLVMLINAICSMLMSYFYEVQVIDNAYFYVPKHDMGSFSYLTSAFLSTTTFVCMGIALLTILGLVIFIRKNTDRTKRGENVYQKAKKKKNAEPPMPSGAFDFDDESADDQSRQ